MKPNRVYRDYLEDMFDALKKGAGFVEGVRVMVLEPSGATE